MANPRTRTTTFSRPGSVFFSRGGQPLVFRDPEEIIRAETIPEVMPGLLRAQAALDAGAYVAGFVAYEAAPAFDAALSSHSRTALPLLWFGIYARPEAASAPRTSGADFHIGEWRSRLGREEYLRSVSRIRDLIGAGDAYQVNFTFAQEASFSGDPFAWFQQLRLAQETRYSAYISGEDWQIASLSPELFFSRERGAITAKPMKGTWARGRWLEEDLLRAEELRLSAKDRAENLMIVDLLRNDLGRVSPPRAVSAPRMFEVERFDTVWQMTSTIRAETKVTLPELIKTLFPCGSVTGAPKIRAMQIIRELEPAPRGVYCGTIGWAAPDGRAEFNVAIRTATIARGRASFHIGSGITWDSVAEHEWAECGLKAAFLTQKPRSFELLETMRFDGDYFLMERHLRRLGASADYFGYSFPRERLLDALSARRKGLQERNRLEGLLRVRVLLAKSGVFSIDATPIPPLPSPLRLSFAVAPVDPSQPELFHKTTERTRYDRARANRLAGADDVLMFNPEGLITELTFANVVLELGGRLYTPPRESGLLAGVFRAELLESGQIEERYLTRADVLRADRIFGVNALRGWIDCELVAGAEITRPV